MGNLPLNTNLQYITWISKSKICSLSLHSHGQITPGSREKVVIRTFFFQSNFANDSLSVYPSQSVKVSMAYIYLGEAQFHFHLYNEMVFICWDISYLLLSKTNLHYLRHSLSKLKLWFRNMNFVHFVLGLLIKLRTMSWDLFSYMAHGIQLRVETKKPSVANSKQTKSQSRWSILLEYASFIYMR